MNGRKWLIGMGAAVVVLAMGGWGVYKTLPRNRYPVLPAELRVEGEFKKWAGDKAGWEEELIKEVETVGQADGVEFRCSPNYRQQFDNLGKPYFYYQSKEGDQQRDLSGPFWEKLMEQIKKQLEGGEIATLQWCETEEGEWMVKTGTFTGGRGEAVKVGWLDKNFNLAEKMTRISNNTAYFGCFEPGAISRNGQVYYWCGGDMGYQAVYKFDREEETGELIGECLRSQEGDGTKAECVNFRMVD